KQVEDQTIAREKNTKATIKSRIVQTLKSRGGKALMRETLDGITGRDALKYGCRDELIKEGVIKMTGVARSNTNPLHLVLLQPDWTASVNKPEAPQPAPE